VNDEQLAFLREIVTTTGPSGYEAATQTVWRKRVSSVAPVHTDVLGSAIATINPSGSPRVMLEAHIDEIGFQVKYIDENGFIYFHPIGGFDPSTLAGNRVRIIGKNGPVLGVIGRRATHLMSADDRKKAPELKKLWIDIGAKDRAEAQQYVAVGDGGGRAHGFERMLGNLIVANSFDDRVGSYIMAETAAALAAANPTAAVFVASCVQEEIGLRGAGPTAFGIDAPIGVAVDVTHPSDHPEAPKTEIGDVRIGGGPVISRGANTNPRIFERLVAAAGSAGVPYQVEAEPRGTGTDQNAMYTIRGGMATGLVSVPLRYMHTASEIIDISDVDATVALLTRFVLDLGSDVNLTP
jgi:tetrahedral aminopeptidase